jgi:hypothetical protein
MHTEERIVVRRRTTPLAAQAACAVFETDATRVDPLTEDLGKLWGSAGQKYGLGGSRLLQR